MKVSWQRFQPTTNGQQLIGPLRSPVGNYAIAITQDGQELMLFDFATDKWSELSHIGVGTAQWSRDRQYVYRYWIAWMGLAPDGSPLLMRDTGTQEVFTLDFHLP